jgi:hypothetical protein
MFNRFEEFYYFYYVLFIFIERVFLLFVCFYNSLPQVYFLVFSNKPVISITTLRARNHQEILSEVNYINYKTNKYALKTILNKILRTC